MTKVEVLVRYRWLMQEAVTISKQADRLIKLGGPVGIGSHPITGMPRGTNDPVAAGIQAFDGYIRELRTKAAEIASIGHMFEETLSLIKDDRARDICRMYYALGMTDDQIGQKKHMDQATVNRIRNDILKKLHNISLNA